MTKVLNKILEQYIIWNPQAFKGLKAIFFKIEQNQQLNYS